VIICRRCCRDGAALVHPAGVPRCLSHIAASSSRPCGPLSSAFQSIMTVPFVTAGGLMAFQPFRIPGAKNWSATGGCPMLIVFYVGEKPGEMPSLQAPTKFSTMSVQP
jgi:hypothetical protein